MDTKEVSFKNRAGDLLEGRLDLPSDQRPHNYVVFAHCFTCNKNLNAIRHICTSLTGCGFAVLRFDFTGLGQSEGSFADSNFSSNVSDLIEAADFLRDNYKAPSLIIGHSLGGAAAIYAAAQVPSIQAVAVIAAPSEPVHVLNLIKDSEDEILARGQATVRLEGRDFTIKKQFIDDLNQVPMTEVLHRLKKPILIFHSPDDRIVNINNAEQIYRAASHPKSFISLDGADHLMSKKEDSRYVGSVIAGWAVRYLPMPEEETVSSPLPVAASLDGDEGFTTHLKLGSHSFTADEPLASGGNNYGPSPYDLLAGSLAACTAMTLQMYARRKAWDLRNVTVHVAHSKDHAKDCDGCEDNSVRVDLFSRAIALQGTLTEEQKARLLEMADRCPVHRTLRGEIEIRTSLKD